MSKEDNFELIEKLETGEFIRDYSGRLCYEISELSSGKYIELQRLVRKKFHLIPMSLRISTPDEIFQSYFSGLKRVGIEWGNWSGFIVVAKNKKAEKLVMDIGYYLESQLKL